MYTAKSIGDKAENAITSILLRRGFKLIARNFSVHNVGELDVVMRRNNTIYVFEVKSRLEGNSICEPIDAITISKRRKMERTTQILVNRLKLFDCNICYYAGLVTHNRDGIIQNIKIIPFE